MFPFPLAGKTEDGVDSVQGRFVEGAVRVEEIHIGFLFGLDVSNMDPAVPHQEEGRRYDLGN